MASLCRQKDARGKLIPWWFLRWYDREEKKQRWEAIRYPDGRRVKNRRDALYFKAEKEKEVAQGKRHQRGFPFSQAVSLYLKATKPTKSADWHYTTTRHLATINKRLGDPPLASLSSSQVESCLNDIAAKRKLSQRSRNHYLQVLRTMSRWCINREYIWRDFTRGITLTKVVKPAPTYLSTEQRETLLKLAKDSPYYPMVATALFAGLRWEELVYLEWEDVDLVQKVIQVRPKAHWLPKSRRPRTIPLDPRLRAILRPLRQKSGRCFAKVGVEPTRIFEEKARRTMRRWLKDKKVGLKGRGLGWHVLRRTFASLLAQNNVSVVKVSKWLGHADWRTTQIYAHVPDRYDEAITLS